VGTATLVRARGKRHTHNRKPVQASRYSAAWYLRLWAGGFVAASALVMLVSPYFVSSLKVYEWSPALEDYVFAKGYVHRERGEGWAATRYGDFGLSGTTPALAAQGQTILIWGDSFVEAHNVADSQKAASQVTQVFSQGGRTRITATAVGYSYWSVADYYFNIPYYEKLLNPICHFIVLAEHGLADICPDEERFLSAPTYQFVHCGKMDPQKSQKMRVLTTWHLQDLVLAPWKAARNVAADLQHARFLPVLGRSPRPESRNPGRLYVSNDADPNVVIAGWTYALTMLKSSTKKSIVLVSVPEVPVLQNGEICCEDPQSQWNARLAKLCREQGIGYIDMAQTLVDDYRATGRLSRGFHNGVPGCGHLNARGHYLLSEVICAYLREHFGDSIEEHHVVHAN